MGADQSSLRIKALEAMVRLLGLARLMLYKSVTK
jgi:hypothetical protein